MSRCAFSVFCFYSDSLQRRQALKHVAPGSAERYFLYGLDQFVGQGVTARHNLIFSACPSPRARRLSRGFNKLLACLGGYGGDFATVWAFRGQIGAANLVFSTVDTVGIPLVLLRHLGLICRPIVYVSIGLLERIKRLRSNFMQELYRRAFSRVEVMVAYGFQEAEDLREWLGQGGVGDIVHFVPFGVDTEYFYPFDTAVPEIDVLSIGADPCRNFSLLIEFARRHPSTSVRIITTSRYARELGELPYNVQLLRDVPFTSIRDQIAATRVIALPVKQNNYSGATTTLLQAMAMAKPVVVSAVGAISQGYHLENGVNCKLVTPDDARDLGQALSALLADPSRAQTIGASARQTVVEHHSWDQYVRTLLHLFEEALDAATKTELHKRTVL
jgi:glycosyltransferase involved in cell wall biosynthesis